MRNTSAVASPTTQLLPSWPSHGWSFWHPEAPVPALLPPLLQLYGDCAAVATCGGLLSGTINPRGQRLRLLPVAAALPSQLRQRSTYEDCSRHINTARRGRLISYFPPSVTAVMRVSPPPPSPPVSSGLTAALAGIIAKDPCLSKAPCHMLQRMG
ncbi:hypothetical protein JKP88DRAFT_224411 [Tribonema minus]|uniref:Uncharacterized protein n=1 Tax=Tribonema minus TaxID=303371 RepID=A0A836CCR7_9STRA|nr:hypothetical protein JKP88DRAFT_224411 [Tribonema minus]